MTGLDCGKQWTAFGLLGSPSAAKVLMRPDNHGWSLPSVRVSGQGQLTIPDVTPLFATALDLPLIAYRPAAVTNDENGQLREAVFALESRDPATGFVEGGSWVTRHELGSLQLNRPDHLNVIDGYLRELETGHVSNLRRTWERPGWFHAANQWVRTALESLGYEVVMPPRQVRWWSLSSVLQVGTNQGDVYFKASARLPLLADEPTLLEFMATLCPVAVPKPIAVDHQRHWMLMEAAGKPLQPDLSIESKRDIFRAYARVQQETIPHLNQLIELGCADRRPHRLIPSIEPVVEGVHAIRGVAPLSADEINELRDDLPAFIQMCSRLSTYSVPYTLLHGDLHLENVIARDENYCFTDWTEACIGHPFMDMFLIFNERDEAIHNQLRDAYLSMWIDFEPMHCLLELWSMIGVVHALHHAVSYHSMLDHAEEPSQSELAGTVPFLLRKALRYMRVSG